MSFDGAGGDSVLPHWCRSAIAAVTAQHPSPDFASMSAWTVITKGLE
ncbi:MAG TPA: hypothetical protein VHU19_07665 [Pyrinomonadaceae bacterium]|nr:hypothetical protein [Pyrinomonadaceae bacterium]